MYPGKLHATYDNVALKPIQQILKDEQLPLKVDKHTTTTDSCLLQISLHTFKDLRKYPQRLWWSRKSKSKRIQRVWKYSRYSITHTESMEVETF